MKHFFQKSILTAAVFASVITLSSFNNVKKTEKATVSAYEITRLSTDLLSATGQQQWTWKLTNVNPGNGLNGTLQDVSHWSIPLSTAAEAAFVSAEYSFDGITWYTLVVEIERDPSIRFCTTTDVLKFNVGTSGSQPTYYRATFSTAFATNINATAWVKTGSGRTGCNLYYFEGIGNVVGRTND